MDNTQIKELSVNQELVGYYLVKDILLKEGANGCYLDITFSDQTGTVNAKLWKCDPKDADRFPKGSLVKVMGRVTEFRGKLQMNVVKIRLAKPEDGVSIEDFVASAPIDAQTMFDEVYGFAEAIGDTEIRKVTCAMLTAEQSRLLYYPAAKVMHHAVRSGLLYHMLRMLRLARGIAGVYGDTLDEDLLVAGVILHDMEKLNEMKADRLGLAEYTLEGELLGHLVMGVKRIAKACEEMNISEKTSLALQHMVLSHHQKPEYGSPKMPMIPEAEVLHYIDMIDARVFSFEEALRDLEPNEMSERVFPLDNRRVWRFQKG